MNAKDDNDLVKRAKKYFDSFAAKLSIIQAALASTAENHSSKKESRVWPLSIKDRLYVTY